MADLPTVNPNLATILSKLIVASAINEAKAKTDEVVASIEGKVVAPVSPEAVEAHAAKVLTQDPWYRSFRVWAVISGALTLAQVALVVFLDPGVQGELAKAFAGQTWATYLPLLTMIGSVLLPMISKAKDQRPTNGA